MADAEKPKHRRKREPRRNDPRLVAAARELRDRYLEEVNRPGSVHQLNATAARYDVSRAITAEARLPGVEMLPAA